jgi:hypothetical protein
MNEAVLITAASVIDRVLRQLAHESHKLSLAFWGGVIPCPDTLAIAIFATETLICRCA